MIRTRFSPGVAAAASLLLLGAVSPAARAQFVGTNFQDIDPPFAYPGATNPYGEVSEVGGISNTGAIAGTYVDTDSVNTPSARGYILQNGVYTTVSYSAQAGTIGNSTFLLSVNSSGVSVGYYDASGTSFIRSATGTFSSPQVTLAGATDTYLNSINDAGLVTAQYIDASGLVRGAVYNYNTNSFTSFLPGVIANGNTYLQFAGSNGTLVGSYDDGTANTPLRAFLYRNGAFTTFNAPGATSTRFNGINAAGIVSGRYLDSNGLSHGLVYNTNNGVFSTIDFPGASQTLLLNGSINDSNQIAGTYIDQSGIVHSFRGGIVSAAAPEPSALALLTTGAGLLGSTLVRRRKRSA